jgi:hypothetical protein
MRKTIERGKKLIICFVKLCNVGAGVAVSIAAEHGLGRSPDALTEEQLVLMQKALYVSELFYVLTLCLAKLSLIVLLYFLSQLTSHRPKVLATGGAIVIWALTSIFAVSFQCRTPDVWNIVSGSCIDTVSLAYDSSSPVSKKNKKESNIEPIAESILAVLWRHEYPFRGLSLCGSIFYNIPHDHEFEEEVSRYRLL